MGIFNFKKSHRNESNLDENLFLDDRNRDLWNSLKNCRDIKIIKGNEDNYGAYSINSNSIIYVTDKIDSSSFTHELLHIYLTTKFIMPSATLFNLINGNEILFSIFCQNLIDHFGNVIEHKKMFPLFIKLGYKESDFLDDYYVYKMNDEELAFIKYKFDYKNNIYYSDGIECYIKSFFAMKCCPNTDFNYDKYYDKLKLIDNNLYKILDDFMVEWDNFDIEEDENYKYRFVLSNLVYNLEDWISDKNIL